MIGIIRVPEVMLKSPVASAWCRISGCSDVEYIPYGHVACCAIRSPHLRLRSESMKPLNWLAAAALAISLPALADISDADGGAMKKLASANLHEIEAGKLAASKAQNPQVKQFGQKMADDHAQ